MLRGGVIGFGRMGVTHYSILNTHPNIQFVAVCDQSKFTLKNLKRYTSLQLFSNYEKMLDKAEMEFIIVSTPTASHADIIRKGAQKGLHMFVEKPFSLEAENGKELVTAVENENLVNQVGYFLRFNAIFGMVKKLIVEGFIGEVVHYVNEMYGRTVLKASKSSWRSKKEMGGGCLLDFASHCIDFSHFLFGPVKAVSGSILKSVYSSAVEDAVYTILEHEGGITGNITVNWSDESYRRPYNRIEIFGKKGKIIADRQEYRLYLREADGSGQFQAGWNIHYLPELDQMARFSIRGSEFTNQLDHFIECVEKRKPQTACTFADALRTDCVIEEVKRTSM